VKRRKVMKLSISHKVSVVVLSTVACLAGCAAPTDSAWEDDTEEMSSSKSAWSVNSCATVSASRTFTYNINGGWTTPSGAYGIHERCGDSVVVDLNTVSGTDGYFQVAFAHSSYFTEASCAETMVGGILYKKDSGGAWAAQSGQVRAFGVWRGGILGCQVPAVSFNIASGQSYRIAGTARMIAPSYPLGDPGQTRKISFMTWAPVR
jgi:hypothetical protein